ncbi:hypothetical protein HOD20_01260 [archaeon]|nr:hypothetical protein [archaeon]
MIQKQNLKQRIFGIQVDEEIDESKNSDELIHIDNKEQLEEILSALTNQEKSEDFVVFDPIVLSNKKNELLEDSLLVVEEDILTNKAPKLVLYQTNKDTYSVYVRSSEDPRDVYNFTPNLRNQKEKEHNYGLFIPSGVTVRRVSQNSLGNGVLGRAFIGQNYIEILDSLSGNAYQEVLTHEVLHIIHPEKKEMEIRNMTRNYIGAAYTVYH